MQQKSHRRRFRRQQTPESNSSPAAQSPRSAPLPPVKLPKSLSEESKKLLPGNHNHNHNHNINKRANLRRSRTGSSPNGHKDKETSTIKASVSDPSSCWEFTGMNFFVPVFSLWSTIFMIVFWSELKDNALDYYYLHFPEQQPLSPVPGTVLPLIPNLWLYDADKAPQGEGDNGTTRLNKQVRDHLKEHRQPHYYMLPQDYYDQQPPSDTFLDIGTIADEASNTAVKAPEVRGVLIVLHNCHQSGLHFFQLPESRIVAAHALQQGLAIFSPTASAASSLSAPAKKANKKLKPMNNNMDDKEKHCWSASLDGDELLGPLLYEWAREMGVTSLPRIAIGIVNGANLIIDSSLYKTLRLQSIALYGSHHLVGFDKADLELDVVPATAFVVFPKNQKATEFALKQFHKLQQQEDEDEEKLREEEENAELEKELEEVKNEEGNGSTASKDSTQKIKTFFRKTELYTVQPHNWTPSLCQARLPEYHTRCRSFFRHLARFQISKQRKAEERERKRDPQQRIKRIRLGNNLKQKYQLLSSKGEVLQSSYSTVWEPVMESLGLDDWTTHTMAFNLASSGRTKVGKTKKQLQKMPQLVQFPTIATPEGRSWLWASMLQEIEVAYGMQEMTSEFSVEILDFLMYHAGLSLRG